MTVYRLNPLTDQRWPALVANHMDASVFHRVEWLKALHLTYDYEPVVLTTSSPQESLANGLAFCRLSSWLTGTRLVSLPFSDHCEPLFDRPESAEAILSSLHDGISGFNYIELRPFSAAFKPGHGLEPKSSYYFHELDLAADLGQIFSNMHVNSFQRNIRKAERGTLSYVSGRSEENLGAFYRLLIKTRRRHGVIPQPLKWFKNLSECMGDNLQIRLAYKSDTPIAAILTLRHGSKVVYKYGCSDKLYHHLGGMPFLFWRLIEESKQSGATTIDLGRSDLDNAGLNAFKDRLGAVRKSLTYYRYSLSKKGSSEISWQFRSLKTVFANLPDAFLSAAGRCLYRHLG